MVKTLSALAVLALLGASVVSLPGFAPSVEASEITVLGKSDRLEVRTRGPNCSIQIWPDFASVCLRMSGSTAKISEARVVTARR
ncbi:hypothetical protein HAP47_0028395 [Bradyrhizobium sp. 41S5]|nr:hypothetical protein [Bradyrhizobium sp. 41S5]UFX43121.1 hypothetical protein HAP47_0028395 [Bradyrhizobium sp. 41S5]